ncbi:MAG: ABC transporter substrate-binding protein [Hyphomicrobiaceae bacterium]
MKVTRATLSTASVMAVAFTYGAVAVHAADLTAQEKKLIEAAKKEGSVTIIHPLFSDRTAQRMAAAFKKRYGLGDGFKFNSLRKGTGSTVAQVRQEIKAGKFTVDMIMVHSPSFFHAAAKRGAFLEMDSGYWNEDHAAGAKAAGQYSDYPRIVTPLAYSFQPVWNSACPGMADFKVTSYADVLDPKYKGKTIVSDITKSFTYTNSVISLRESGYDVDGMWTKLKATDPIVEFRTEPKMQMLISCQRPIDMWNLSGRVYQNVKKKPDLAGKIKQGTFKEGHVMLGNQMAVLKGAKNPNAAKLLAEFLLSKEGTDIAVEGEAIYSFRKNYTPPAAAKPYLMDLSKTKIIGMKDWVGASKLYKKERSAWQATFR